MVIIVPSAQRQYTNNFMLCLIERKGYSLLSAIYTCGNRIKLHTWESKPSVSIIIKNKTAQNGAPGSCVTANGNTMNERPLPDETTSFTSCWVTNAK